MKHNMKAGIKRILYGVYTYGYELVKPNVTFTDIKDYYDGRDYYYNSTIKYIKSPAFRSSVGDVTHAVRTDLCEKAIEKILAELSTGWKNAILIISPFRASVLTALLLLKTDEPTRIRYTVKGMRGSKDLTLGEDDFSTSHRVPIVGLFEDAKNTVIISIENENSDKVINKSIKIKTPNVMEEYFDIQLKMTYSAHDITDDEEKFYEVSGGYRGPTCIFDSHANVRFFFSRKPHYYGIYLLDNGTFLWPEHLLKRPVFGAPLSVVAHEMDWFGRYHHTYFHEIGYHHDAVVLPDGNFMTISSTLVNKHVENKLVKIDRETGDQLDELSMDELFDDTYQNSFDWCHINSISPMDDPDELILCLRNIHTICRVSMREHKLIWILTNPEMFRGTAQESLVLTPEGEFDPWFFQQHSARIMRNFPNAEPGRLYITFYDNHEAHRRPVDWFDKQGTSYGLVVSVDEKARSFRLEKRFPTSYAITRANTIYDEKTNHYFTMDARLEDQTEYAADMREWDFDTGELVREYTINQDFFAIHPVELNYKSMAEPLDPKRRLFRGKLIPTEKCELPKGLTEAPLLEQEVKTVRYYRYGNNLLVWAIDQQVGEIILVKQEDPSVCYHIDYVH
ncbi:MAG: aryl-sulfate sulfotransferase, partial [Eubacterium sp.]|nr:aryl-sulfate sulfotransferase [Eubacterium sp.]